ncbi:hypothetical protein H696_03570 [Fonticula alba]|uniref:Uncharacterized protein n=1 Tax=Fonticula alba TaxID=691883 RepID=A0A058Z866_FONAL|nr:hypothetical protein H696_03570 [Fonticula alba]KCV70108.1 hypothetical protein H696_03570 [Fonticula alba]|eukprot:XP_009495714.1 hypothetical protein H696_03570 [Fonticula alba]
MIPAPARIHTLGGQLFGGLMWSWVFYRMKVSIFHDESILAHFGLIEQPKQLGTHH